MFSAEAGWLQTRAGRQSDTVSALSSTRALTNDGSAVGDRLGPRRPLRGGRRGGATGPGPLIHGCWVGADRGDLVAPVGFGIRKNNIPNVRYK